MRKAKKTEKREIKINEKDDDIEDDVMGTLCSWARMVKDMAWVYEDIIFKN